jgi:hypothetical protein
MKLVTIREPQLSDEAVFLNAMQHSKTLHYPWVKAPVSAQEFKEYIERFKKENQKSYLVFTEDNQIAGVFNISEIVHGLFQSA